MIPVCPNCDSVLVTFIEEYMKIGLPADRALYAIYKCDRCKFSFERLRSSVKVN